MTMTDGEIYKCIDEKNKELLGNVKEMMGNFTEALTTLITVENQNLKESLHRLEEQQKKTCDHVEKTTDDIARLKEWKSEHEGELKGRKINTSNLLSIGTVIIAFLMLIISYNNFKNSQEKFKTEVRDYLYPSRVRGAVTLDSLKVVK